MSKKSIGYIVFTAVFVILCAIPSVGMLVFGPSETSANEVLTVTPQMKNPDGSINTDFFIDASDYFNDHFAFRNELITADSAIKATVFHTSSQEQVVLGKDGWLFYGETIDDYTGADTLTDREFYCIARSLKLAEDYISQKGAEFAFAAAPNKISLYPEYYSDGVMQAENPLSESLKAALSEQGVNYADLFTAFENENEILYHKTDSHWTNKGAALAHDAIMTSLGLEATAYEKDGELMPTHEGDLYSMLYPASNWLDDQFEFAAPLDFTYSSPIRNAEDMRIQTASNGENGNLLMFRDSFGNTLHTVMAESFENALFSRAMPYDLARMDDIGANFVVVEIVERNLYMLAEAPFIMPSPTVESMDAESTGGTLSVTAEPALNLAGYQKITGTVDDICDDESPIYISCGGNVYEAFPTSQGASFTAYIPETEDANVLKMFYYKDGALLSSK